MSFDGWSWWTMVPVVSNALGGILVGAVTKHAGGVHKGFAIIFGILLTTFVEYFLYSKPLGYDIWIALILVIASTYIYGKYPYKEHSK